MSPINLNAVARQLGAKDVTYRAQSQGHTNWATPGPKISLALTRSDGRRRATLAHECGHLILDPICHAPNFKNLSPIEQSNRRAWVENSLGVVVLRSLLSAVERLGLEEACDRLSHELLLPKVVAATIVEDWDGSATRLLEVAHEYRLSLSLLLIRLNEAGGEHAMLNARPNPRGEWVVVRAAGLPRSMRGRITCHMQEGLLQEVGRGRRSTEHSEAVKVFLRSARFSGSVWSSVAESGSTRIIVFDRGELKAALESRSWRDSDSIEGETVDRLPSVVRSRSSVERAKVLSWETMAEVNDALAELTGMSYPRSVLGE